MLSDNKSEIIKGIRFIKEGWIDEESQEISDGFELLGEYVPKVINDPNEVFNSNRTRNTYIMLSKIVDMANKLAEDVDDDANFRKMLSLIPIIFELGNMIEYMENGRLLTDSEIKARKEKIMAANNVIKAMQSEDAELIAFEITEYLAVENCGEEHDDTK